MRPVLHSWLRVTVTVWLARALLLCVGIEALEGIHGWPRLIPVVLAACLLLAALGEYRRRGRVATRRR